MRAWAALSCVEAAGLTHTPAGTDKSRDNAIPILPYWSLANVQAIPSTQPNAKQRQHPQRAKWDTAMRDSPVSIHAARWAASSVGTLQIVCRPLSCPQGRSANGASPIPTAAAVKREWSHPPQAHMQKQARRTSIRLSRARPWGVRSHPAAPSRPTSTTGHPARMQSQAKVNKSRPIVPSAVSGIQRMTARTSRDEIHPRRRGRAPASHSK